MGLFFVFSFIAIGLFSLALWSGIAKNRKFGKRPYYLIRSIILFLINGFIAYTVHYWITDPHFTFAAFSIMIILYLLSNYLLEFSIHCQRIEKSLLMDDFRRKVKSFYVIIFLLSLIIISSLYIYINKRQFLIPVDQGLFTDSIPFFVLNFALFVVLSILFIISNFNMKQNIFNLQRGVIRKQDILFTISNYVMVISIVFFLLNGFGEHTDFKALNIFPIQHYPFELLGVINIVYIIRLYSEYFFQRILNNEKSIKKHIESIELKTVLINLVLNSPVTEDTNIIQTTVKDSLERSMRNLVITDYRITGTFIMRCTNNILQVDSEDLIHEYCTPLVKSPTLNLKKLGSRQLNNLILKQSYDINQIQTTHKDYIKDWGTSLIKTVLDTQKPVIVDPIPKEYAGLQRFIGLFPIINIDKFYGIVVVFKDSYDYLFPDERSLIDDLVDDLNVIFAIIEGKKFQIERNRLQDEMDTARNIQVSIIPEKIDIQGYDAAAYMETATEVGGDAYDHVDSKYGNYLGIGDVSGHGLPAGITALIQQAAFQSSIVTSEVLNKTIQPFEIYNVVNKTLYNLNTKRIGSDKFMTQNYLHERGGYITHAGAHEVALLYKKDEDKVIELSNFSKKTAFMGLSPNIDSKSSEGSFQVARGDILILYTDGIIEARNFNNEQFGLTAFKHLILENIDLGSEEIIKLIVKNVKKHASTGDMKRNNGKLADDISILIFKKN